MKTFSVYSFLTILLLSSFTLSNHQDDLDTCIDNNYLFVDTILNDVLTKSKLPGLSITVSQSEKIMYSKGFGYVDVERKIKMLPNTPIRTASVAKVITTTALAKLMTDGKLNIDQPIGNYIPYINKPYADLTTRQIAGHTAGIPHKPQKKKNKYYASVKETMVFFENLPLLFEPDTDYKYSTLGYNLLAVLIAEISGKSYVAYMEEAIFEPLGMTETYPEIISELSSKDAKIYYFKKGQLKLDKKYTDGSYKLAGAGFRSTSEDLTKMMNAYTNGFIASDAMTKMFSNYTLKNGKVTNVGIGWRLSQGVNSQPTIEHAGSWQGARTVVVHYPEEQLTVSIMVNAKCILFIEETAHVIAQFFLNDYEERDLKGVREELNITNNKYDGTTENFNGNLTFTSNKIGRLSTESSIKWLKECTIYYLGTGDNFALSTEFGLMYFDLKFEPKLEGKLFQYQVLGDKFHTSNSPMLQITSKE